MNMITARLLHYKVTNKYFTKERLKQERKKKTKKTKKQQKKTTKNTYDMHPMTALEGRGDTNTAEKLRT